MDKNFIKAFVASILVILIFQRFGLLTTPSPSPLPEAAPPAASMYSNDTATPVSELREEASSLVSATLEREERVSPVSQIPEITHTLVGPESSITLSNVGGSVKQVMFDRYEDVLEFDPGLMPPLTLLRAGPYDGVTRKVWEVQPGGSEQSIQLKTVLGDKLECIRSLRATSSSYLWEAEYQFTNQSDEEIYLYDGIDIGLGDLSMETERMFPVLSFARFSLEDKVERQAFKKIKGTAKTEEPFHWAGIQSTTYSAMARETDLLQRSIWYRYGEEEHIAGAIGTEAFNLAPGQSRHFRIQFYLGPKLYFHLRSLELGFEEIIDYGSILGPITKTLVLLLDYLKGLTGSYGIAIILMTLLVKLVTYPLTKKSMVSMKKMQVVQPRTKQIQEQYKDNPARLQEEMMRLYKEEKVNPFAGCLPMFIQFPIFIAFYKALANSVELQGASFLIIKDLARPDGLLALGSFHINILPIIMSVSQLITQKQTMTSVSDPNQKTMLYMMPVIFLVFFYRMPSGLVMYWLISNLLSIWQTSRIKRHTPA